VKRRSALIALGFAFGIWETIDIFDIEVPAIAAVFAAMFLTATIWLWRRDSTKAAVWLFALFAFEAAVAPSLKHVETVTKVAALSLGVAGAIAAVSVLATRVRSRRRSSVAAA
jgi:hypothetical protein